MFECASFSPRPPGFGPVVWYLTCCWWVFPRRSPRSLVAVSPGLLPVSSPRASRPGRAIVLVLRPRARPLCRGYGPGPPPFSRGLFPRSPGAGPPAPAPRSVRCLPCASAVRRACNPLRALASPFLCPSSTRPALCLAPPRPSPVRARCLGAGSSRPGGGPVPFVPAPRAPGLLRPPPAGAWRLSPLCSPGSFESSVRHPVPPAPAPPISGAAPAPRARAARSPARWPVAAPGAPRRSGPLFPPSPPLGACPPALLRGPPLAPGALPRPGGRPPGRRGWPRGPRSPAPRSPSRSGPPCLPGSACERLGVLSPGGGGCGAGSLWCPPRPRAGRGSPAGGPCSRGLWCLPVPGARAPAPARCPRPPPPPGRSPPGGPSPPCPPPPAWSVSPLVPPALPPLPRLPRSAPPPRSPPPSPPRPVSRAPLPPPRACFGRGFESCRARQFQETPPSGGVFHFWRPSEPTAWLACGFEGRRRARSEAGSGRAGVAGRDRILPGAPVSNKTPPSGGVSVGAILASFDGFPAFRPSLTWRNRAPERDG